MRRISIKQVILTVFFFVLTFLLFIEQKKADGDILIYISFFAIGLYSLFQIILESGYCTFSCNMLHWLFMFFFMFCSPYLQYTSGSFALGYEPTDNQLLKTNFLILAWCCVYTLFFCFKNKRSKQKEKGALFNLSIISRRRLYVITWFSIAISSLIALYMLRKGGTSIIFSRAAGEGVFVSSSSVKTSLMTYLCRNFVTFSAALAILYFKKSKNPLPIIIMAILLIITCSPIGMPRFQTATVYCGLLIIAFPKITNKISFVICFALAFMVIFPMINVFRYVDFHEYNILQLFSDSLKNIAKNLTDGNFDAYVMFVKTQKYVQANGITYGKQLLGAIFFFIPRSLWNSKPYGSGYTIHVAEGKTGAAANVSCPLPAEGYINFGILGVVFFAAVLACVIRKLDKDFYQPANTCRIMRNKIVYAFIPTIVFFMLRGDLMSTTSFLVSYIVIGKIMTCVAVGKLLK